jgi:hypothetical protein
VIILQDGTKISHLKNCCGLSGRVRFPCLFAFLEKKFYFLRKIIRWKVGNVKKLKKIKILHIVVGFIKNHILLYFPFTTKKSFVSISQNFPLQEKELFYEFEKTGNIGI